MGILNKEGTIQKNKEERKVERRGGSGRRAEKTL